MGVPVGVNTMPIVQLDPFANVDEHDPPDLVKSDPFVPLNVLLVNVMVVPLAFVIVTFCAALGLLCKTSPKAKDVGL